VNPSAAPLLAAFQSLDHVVLLAVALFAVGLVGVTCRRNVLLILLSVEILLNAANLALVAFSRLHANLDGQVFVFFTMTVAAAEVAVGLAIVIALFRLRHTTDVGEVRELHEVDYGPVPVLRLEGQDAVHAHAEPHDGGHDGDDLSADEHTPHAGHDHAEPAAAAAHDEAHGQAGGHA
jgi:NADH-quinone oxidoreductase subunit K